MLHAKRSGSELLFRSKFGVLAQPVAIALDRDDDGMVQQTVEERCGNDGGAEDFSPLAEAAV